MHNKQRKIFYAGEVMDSMMREFMWGHTNEDEIDIESQNIG